MKDFFILILVEFLVEGLPVIICGVIFIVVIELNEFVAAVRVRSGRKLRMQRARETATVQVVPARRVTQDLNPEPAEGEMLDPWLRRRGWTFDGSRLTGNLRHQDGTTQARMDLRDGGFEVFLRQPPQWLRQHPEFGGCVQHRGHGWYLLNQHTRFNDPKTVVIAAEDFMQECFDTSTDVEESEE